MRDQWDVRRLSPLGVAAAIVAIGLLCSASGSVYATQQGNYLLLVDTSGSMSACYAPGPNGSASEVQRFVSALVTDVMAPGDNLIMIPFDSEVRDDVASSAVIRQATAEKAASELRRLDLRVRPGRGTVRSAAIGRGLQRLEAFLREYPDARKRNSAVIVMTDSDDDVSSSGGYADAKTAYDKALTSRALRQARELRSGPLLVSIYSYQPIGLAPRTADSSLPLAALKAVVDRIFGRSAESAAVLRDLTAGAIAVSSRGPAVISNGMRTIVVPLTASSSFRQLYVVGDLAMVGTWSRQGRRGVGTPKACAVAIGDGGSGQLSLSLPPIKSGQGSGQEFVAVVTMPQAVPWYHFTGRALQLTLTPVVTGVRLSPMPLVGADVEARMKTLGVRLYPYSTERMPDPTSIVIRWHPPLWPLWLIVGVAVLLFTSVRVLMPILRPPVRPVTIFGYYGTGRQPLQMMIDKAGQEIPLLSVGRFSLVCRRPSHLPALVVYAPGVEMKMGGALLNEVMLDGDEPKALELQVADSAGTDPDDPKNANLEVFVALAPFPAPPRKGTAAQAVGKGRLGSSGEKDESWLS